MSFEDNEDISASVRPSSLLIGLPDELMEWVDQNHAMIRRVQEALADSYASLTEEQLWDAVAASASPEWRAARQQLDDAEAAVNEFSDPLHKPLGAIGAALEHEEMVEAHASYDISLAQFTIINEGLMQRKDLTNLLQVLLVQQRMLGQSAARTRRVQQMTNALAEMVSLKKEFNASARNGTSRVQRQFKSAMRKIFLPGGKKPAVTSAIVPWSPGT